jgi:hypothetical protein
MRPTLCVHCHKPREGHHPTGWCYWLSATDHLPMRFETTPQTGLQGGGAPGAPHGRLLPSLTRGPCAACAVDEVLAPSTVACRCLVCAGCALDFWDEGVCGVCGTVFTQEQRPR